ncbi:MAG: pyrroline-5-carboxylate reductase [Sphingobium sp.]
MAKAQDWPSNLVMIGCGNMAGAMLTRWIACGLDPETVIVVRPSGKPVMPGVRVFRSLPERRPDKAVVLLGMKPQQIEQVAADLAGRLADDAVLVSILAGITTERLRSLLPTPGGIVRVMPNTPVAVGEGVCALYADDATSSAARATIEGLMQPLGLVEWIVGEESFNLVTALSGCGPAYLFRFIDALASAGAALGLEPTQAARLAMATVKGAATLASQANESPAILADRVASPGGMTRKGMDVLDREDALAKLLTDTLRAARDRGIELASIG